MTRKDKADIVVLGCIFVIMIITLICIRIDERPKVISVKQSDNQETEQIIERIQWMLTVRTAIAEANDSLPLCSKQVTIKGYDAVKTKECKNVCTSVERYNDTIEKHPKSIDPAYIPEKIKDLEFCNEK